MVDVHHAPNSLSEHPCMSRMSSMPNSLSEYLHVLRILRLSKNVYHALTFCLSNWMYQTSGCSLLPRPSWAIQGYLTSLSEYSHMVRRDCHISPNDVHHASTAVPDDLCILSVCRYSNRAVFWVMVDILWHVVRIIRYIIGSGLLTWQQEIVLGFLRMCLLSGMCPLE